MKRKKYMLEREKTLSIHIYPQTQCYFTNVIETNKRTQKIKLLTDTRYIVDHVYEIVLPLWEKYEQTHNIEIFINGDRYALMDLENAYYEMMNENA